MFVFNLKLYKPSDLETWISNRYKAHGIYSPSDLSIENVAAIFDIDVRTYEGPTFAQWQDEGYSFMFFNKWLLEEEKRERFFHELCHPLRHVGIQDHNEMPRLFQQLQEAQANQFQLFSAMPVYLLENFMPTYNWSSYIRVLADAFILPAELVEQRVTQVMRNIDQERRDRNFKARLSPSPVKYAYTNETNRILDQLQQQLEAKKESDAI